VTAVAFVLADLEFNRMLANYLPVLIFLTVATGLALLLMSLGLIIGRWQSKSRNDAQKLSPYECGFEAFEDSRMKFDVRYYLVAILFIVFDLEIAFLFPWAVVLDTIGTAGLVSMGIFLFILVVGFIYEWKKGALEWD
jgi:NADH-quinone oxidoreductase subunit A